MREKDVWFKFVLVVFFFSFFSSYLMTLKVVIKFMTLKVVDQVHILVSFFIILFSYNLVSNNYERERCMV